MLKLKKVFSYYRRMFLALLISFVIAFVVVQIKASEREHDYTEAISCIQTESVESVKARFEKLGN